MLSSASRHPMSLFFTIQRPLETNRGRIRKMRAVAMPAMAPGTSQAATAPAGAQPARSVGNSQEVEAPPRRAAYTQTHDESEEAEPDAGDKRRTEGLLVLTLRAARPA